MNALDTLNAIIARHERSGTQVSRFTLLLSRRRDSKPPASMRAVLSPRLNQPTR